MRTSPLLFAKGSDKKIAEEKNPRKVEPIKKSREEKKKRRKSTMHDLEDFLLNVLSFYGCNRE